MQKNQNRIKITRTGRIVKMLDMFEVIEKAEEEFKKPFEEGMFEFGKGVVLFKDNECGCITYVIQSAMPMPYHIADVKPDVYEDMCNTLEKTMEEQGLIIIKAKSGVYVDAPNYIKEDIKKTMQIKGYNTINLK